MKKKIFTFEFRDLKSNGTFTHDFTAFYQYEALNACSDYIKKHDDLHHHIQLTKFVCIKFE